MDEMCQPMDSHCSDSEMGHLVPCRDDNWIETILVCFCFSGIWRMLARMVMSGFD